MKFKQIAELEKQIEAGFSSGKPLRTYLVVHAQREERRKLLEKIAQLLAKSSQGEVFFQEGKEWDSVYGTLGAPSLFGDPEVIVWDSLKSLSEEGEEKLQKYVMNPSSWAFLLIGADSLKSFSSTYAKASKEVALLDLTGEKPWDKEKRQQQELLQKAKLEGKNITPGALARLLSLSEDSLTLESELMKVISYIGDRPSIVEKDIAAVTVAPLLTRWQLAEELIWDKGRDHDIGDLSALIALIAQVRFLLQQARRVSTYLQEKKSPEAIMKATNLRSAPLQKIMQRVKRCKEGYFNSALSMLCDVEVLSKNSALDPSFLFHYLRMQFAELRKDYVR